MSFCLAGTLLLTLAAAQEQKQPFGIEVVDAQTKRGVPLVELKTVHGMRWLTDSQGFAAVDAPELMGQRVFFHVWSHGYEFPADGFGIRGKALEVAPGGSARLEITRLNIAERLYRMTGGGIYGDSVQLGKPIPINEGLLNAKVLGQDSVQTVVYRGRIHWFWGDTNWPAYPLGNFHAPGATSELPGRGGLDPDKGVNLAYFIGENGFAKPTAKMPGEGPTWIGGLAVLKGEAGQGQEQLLAGYVKVKPGMSMEAYEHGLIRWNGEKSEFEKVKVFPEGLAMYPEGHTFQHRGEDGVLRVYFAVPYPHVRVRAEVDAMADPANYEGFSCLKAGTRAEAGELDRDAEGRLRYGWKANTPPLNFDQQAKLIKEGRLKEGEGILALCDVETGKLVRGHGSSASWSEYKRKWVLIVVEAFGGPSFLGEVWYAESDAPEGPWVYARKVVTHEKYSFYNPRHHPFLDQEGGRRIYFEGTYTATFSGNESPTPRYDYNQVMYRLDLGEERLNLPVAFDLGQTGPGGGRVVQFFALGAPAEGTVPLFGKALEGGARRLVAAGEAAATDKPEFHVLRLDAEGFREATVPLYEFLASDGGAISYRYGTGGPESMAGYKRAEKPLGRVWPSPIVVEMPAGSSQSQSQSQSEGD